jgi:hypothetical protein
MELDDETDFSPEWLEANKEKLERSGVKLVTKEEFGKLSKTETERMRALRDLGIDVEKDRKEDRGSSEPEVLPWSEWVDRVAAQIDLLPGTTQWQMLSVKRRTELHAVRVFIRQLRGESAPQGQAATLDELFSLNPTGAFAARTKKPYRLSNAHLEAVGVLGRKKLDKDSLPDPLAVGRSDLLSV